MVSDVTLENKVLCLNNYMDNKMLVVGLKSKSREETLEKYEKQWLITNLQGGTKTRVLQNFEFSKLRPADVNLNI